MALPERPAVWLALIEDEALEAEVFAQKTQIFGSVLAVFDPQYPEPPYSVKGLCHLLSLLHRWSLATSTEMQRLHRRASVEIRALERDHKCTACMSPHELQTKYDGMVTERDIARCPIRQVVRQYGLTV